MMMCKAYLSTFLVAAALLAGRSVVSCFGTAPPAFRPAGTPGSAIFSTASTSSEKKTSVAEDQAFTNGENERPAPVFVQREYETYLWMYNLKEYNINYRVEGPVDGPPVLLVHGFGANVNHFRHQFPALVEQGYRVYAIDLIGFGASDKPKNVPYSIELFVELLTEFIPAMHADKPWLIAGNSIGGLCVLSVAEQLPKLIQGVVLFNCSGGMTGFRYQDVPVFIRPLLWLVQNVVLSPTIMGPSFFSNFKTRDNVEGILRESGVYVDQTYVDDELLEILLGPSEDEGAEDVFLQVFAGPPGPTPESILPAVQCPILALWGSRDPWTPLDGGMHPATGFAQYVTGDNQFELAVIEAGHCPHDECPDQIHAKLLPWLKKTRESYDPRE